MINKQAIEGILEKQRVFFNSGKTRDLRFRTEALETLKQGLIDDEQNILKALEEDLGKSPLESYTSEIGVLITDIKLAKKNLKHWAKKRKVKGTPIVFPSKSFIFPEPYGLALIIGPWNYPLQLSISPLIGAIAAGNCSVVKPSEISSATSAVISAIIGKAFAEEFVAVVEGDAEVSGMLLEQKFDKIFFTGSPGVGKIVMEKAARHLTPVTLELGGKNPCIVDAGVEPEITAKRILWGKFFNAGQTCIAPDYLLVHKNIKRDLYAALKKWLNHFYGHDPIESPDFGRIINDHHFRRLEGYLKDGKIIFGGDIDSAKKYIAPTIIEVEDLNGPLMREEVFGPILPVFEISGLDEIEQIINMNLNPLAFYIFSPDSKKAEAIAAKIPFGGGCINDTFSHIMNHNLPFGGRGNSGMGRYRGKYSFAAFSHYKPLLVKGFRPDFSFKYPPYGNKDKLLRKILIK